MGAVRKVLPLSVTEDESKSTNPGQSGIGWLWFGDQSKPVGTLLPQWGEPSRLPKLRQLFYDDRNALVSAAIQDLITQIVQTPWELSGPKTRTSFWQNVMQYPNEGTHFTTFMSKALLDYLLIDQGAFIEIIGRGAPDTELTEAPVGYKVLDSLRCYPVGDDSQPVYYKSYRTGKLHELHPSRVIRWVDTPSTDPDHRNLGRSAMSRAAMAAHVTMLLFRNQAGRLDNKPAHGIILWKNVSKNAVGTSKDAYRSKEALMDDPFAGYLELFAQDPAFDTNFVMQEFSQMPDGTDLPALVQLYVNMTAVAIGVDPQDIFPLSSGNMGSGAQSKILDKKGEARAYGKILTEFERLANTRMLPRNMEFKWKVRDDEGLQQEADVARVWAGVAADLVSKGQLTDSEGRQLLANNVTAIADVLLDESGQVRLPDDDVKDEQTGDDMTPLTSADPDDEARVDDKKAFVAQKAIQATRLNFENDIGNLFAAAVAGEFDRRRFGVRARALIARYGREAYLDGLEEEGVNRLDATDDDRATINELTAEQSKYVTTVGEAIYLDEKVTPDEAENKPQMWWNKSIEPFYRAGQMSAGRNGYKMWGLGPTEDHCSDCPRLDGQIHRLRDWMKKGLFPKSSELECKGYRCECSFSKPEGKARARGSY